MKSAIALILWIIAGMAFAIFVLYYLADYCYVAKPFSVGHGEQQKFYHFNADYAAAKRNKQHSESIISIIKNRGTEIRNDPSAKDGSNETQKPWWREFLCGVKITDVLIAFFTYCLVVVGVFQAFRTTHVITNLERAYLFAALTDIDISSKSGKVTVKYRVRNVGRSPAVLKGFWIKFIKDGPLPLRPKYNGARFLEFDYGIEPNSTKLDIVVEESPHSGDQYVFGYIKYTDLLFRRMRVSRFGNRIFPDRAQDLRQERAGGDRYNDYT